MQGLGVEFVGLKELRRDLKKIDPQLTKELRTEFLQVGQKVAADARSMVPQATGRAAASIRAGVSGNTAYVAGGKKSVPYYGWLDFGSRTPRRGQSRKDGPWKRSGSGPKRGRFIYPAIAKNERYIAQAAANAANQAIAKAVGEHA